MAKTLIALVVVLLVALGLQIVGVVSTPLTKTINIASYDGHNFGIWGYCNSAGEACTSIALGYPESDILPNSNMAILSKLLIVHVVAAGFTLLMLLLVLIGFCGNRKYILALSLLAVPSFLVSLLAFLAEILLFTRHLNFPGWFMLASVVLNGVAIVLLCLQHRHLGDRWQRSSDTTTSGDDEKLINSPPVLRKDSFTQVNQADVFAPKRHGDYHYGAGAAAGAGAGGGPSLGASASAGAGASIAASNASSAGSSGPGPSGPNARPNGSSTSVGREGQRYRPPGQAQAPNRLLNQRQPQPPRRGGPGAGPGYAPGAGPGYAPGAGPGYAPSAGPGYGPSYPGAGGAAALAAYRSHNDTPASSNYDYPQPPALPRKDTDPNQKQGEEEFDFEAPPAGTEIAGVEDNRESFGPGVVPVPRMRKTAGSAAAEPLDDEEARAGNTPTGTPHLVHGLTRDESRVGMVQYQEAFGQNQTPQPEHEYQERQYPQAGRYQGHGQGNAQYQTGPSQFQASPGAPRAAYPGHAHASLRGSSPSPAPSPAPAHAPMHAPAHGYGHMPSRMPPSQPAPSPAPLQAPRGPVYQTQNASEEFYDAPSHAPAVPLHQYQGNLMQRYMQELNTSQEYFEYNSEQDQIPPPPQSPGESDFTSVSQRAEQRAEQPAAAPRENPAQRRAAERSDLVLNANPDFALPGVTGGRRGARRGRGRR